MEEVEQAAVVPQTPAATPAAGESQGDQVEKAGESATPPADAAPEEQPKKSRGGFQKRIDKLTRQVYELTAQLESSRAQPAKSDEKEPDRDTFDDLESYQKALATYTAKQVIREERQKQEAEARVGQARQQHQERATRWETHSEAVAEKYDDADDVLHHFSEEVTLHPYALDAILESDMGGELAYYLGKNEAEAAKIAKLSPARQAIEIGKLEAKLAAKPIKQPSKAAAPIEPVGGKGSADDGLRDDLPIGEWIKRRSKAVHRSRGS